MAQGSGIVVRVVRPEDATLLQRHCFVGNTVEETAARIEGNLRDYADGEAIPLVAEVDGVIAGTAVLQRKRHALYRHRADLCDMIVSGPYQRRGLARRLIEALRSHAAQMGVTIFETSVRGGTSAEEVYRRVGFREYGRLPGGIVEAWGERRAHDEVFFWMPAG